MEASDAEIAARLRAILQRDEFQPKVADRAWANLGHWIEAILRRFGGLGLVIRLLVLGGCVVVLALIAGWIWSLLPRGAARRTRGAGSRPRGDAAGPSPQGLVAIARALMAKGALRDAARTLQHAILLATCEEQHVPWRPALADWEWVRLLRPSDGIVAMTRHTERLAFGPAPSREDLEACAEKVQALVVSEGRPR